MATFYGIGSVEEAEAYSAHPILGPRLRECVAALNDLDGRSAVEILDPVDAAKFRSCLTLFSTANPSDSGLRSALAKYFAGEPDERSLGLLGTSRALFRRL